MPTVKTKKSCYSVSNCAYTIKLAAVFIYLSLPSGKLRKHSFLYKSISGFEGNTRLQYGYVNAFTTEDGIPFLNETLRVSTNWEAENYSEKAAEANIENEDAILLAEDLVVVEEFDGEIWNLITGKEYIEKRNKLITPTKEYTDYMKQADSVKLSQFNELAIPEADDKVIPTDDEMELLFFQWNKAH
jgi:hypothetical protein